MSCRRLVIDPVEQLRVVSGPEPDDPAATGRPADRPEDVSAQ